MIDPTSAAECRDNALLLEISEHAHRIARKKYDADTAADIAQDVVVDCLVKMREGTWTARPETLESVVRRMVKARRIDGLRRSQRRDERHVEHSRELTETPRAWMSPDLAAEERELAKVHERALDSLPPACRRTYLMVREEGVSYEVAAERLGVSRSAVSWQMVSAQRRFRAHLREHGIEADT